MTGKILIVALALLALAISSADAATRHKRKNNALTEPAAQVTGPRRAPSFADYECWTDEGYGRRLPCDYGGK